MKRKSSKFLSLFLTLALMFSCLPLGATSAQAVGENGPYKPQEAAANSANLSGLVIENDQGAVTLDQPFDPDTTQYSLPNQVGIGKLDITATTENPSATLTINNQLATSGQPHPTVLGMGVNALEIIVKSADGTTSKTYNLAVERISAGKFKLTVEGGTSTPAIPADGWVEAGEWLHLEANPPAGKLFHNWLSKDVYIDGILTINEGVLTESELNFTMPKGDASFKALFIPIPDANTHLRQLEIWMSKTMDGSLIRAEMTPIYTNESTEKDFVVHLPMGYDTVKLVGMKEDYQSMVTTFNGLTLAEEEAAFNELLSITQDESLLKIKVAAPNHTTDTYNFKILRNSTELPKYKLSVSDYKGKTIKYAYPGEVLTIESEGAYTGTVFSNWNCDNGFNIPIKKQPSPWAIKMSMLRQNTA